MDTALARFAWRLRHRGASPCAMASAVNCARLIVPVFARKFREWKRTVTSVTSIALAMKAVERPSMRCSRHSRSRAENSGGPGHAETRLPAAQRLGAIEHHAGKRAQSEAFLGAARVRAADKSDRPELVVGSPLRDDIPARDAEPSARLEHADGPSAVLRAIDQCRPARRNSPPRWAGSMRRNLLRLYRSIHAGSQLAKCIASSVPGFPNTPLATLG